MPKNRFEFIIRKRSRILFVGPESDHWECLSLTDSLTDSCLVNLIDVTLACEDAYSKLVEVVTVANVYDEKRVVNSLVQIWRVKFGHNVISFCSDFEHEVSRFGQDFEDDVQARF